MNLIKFKKNVWFEYLNRRQSISVKKYNLSLRLVLFFPSRCCFAGSLQFSSSRVKQTDKTIPLQFPTHFFIFFKTMNSNIKQLLDSLFVITGVIRFSVSVISRGWLPLKCRRGIFRSGNPSNGESS